MKIVCLTYRPSPDVHDPQEWLNRIRIYVGSWEKLSSQQEIIRVEQIGYEGRLHLNGIDYHFVRFGKRKSYLPWRLHRYVRKLNPDWVVVAGLHYPLQVIQLRWQMPAKVKIILQNHAEKPFRGFKKYWQAWADHYVHAYLFASADFARNWISKGNIRNPEKTHEVMEVSSIFCPVDPGLAKEKTGVLADPAFLWVGRLDENKDPLTAVTSFLRFVNFYPEAKLYLIYQTEECLEKLQNLIGKENKTVVLVGKVDHADMPYWYCSAPYIISSSHYEGSGTAVCEAMSCGCIPILTDIDAFRTMTGRGACGILYEKANEEALLAALLKVMQQDPEEMKARTLKQFHEHLSFEAIARKIGNLLNYPG